MRTELLGRGSFKKYVDQILSNFDHLPNSIGQLWTIYILPILCSRKQAWTFYQFFTASDHLPTSTCPHKYLPSYWMPHCFTQWFEMRRSRHRISNSWFDELMSVRFVLHYSDITSPRSDRGRLLTHNGATAFVKLHCQFQIGTTKTILTNRFHILKLVFSHWLSQWKKN